MDADQALETTLIILAVIGALVYLIIKTLPTVRHQLNKRRSQNWPLASATIQTCEVSTDHAARRAQELLYKCQFGYEYSVEGTRYSGLFALRTVTDVISVNVRNQLMGQQVTARYDPANPQISFLQESMLTGRTVLQDPHWLQ